MDAVKMNPNAGDDPQTPEEPEEKPEKAPKPRYQPVSYPAGSGGARSAPPPPAATGGEGFFHIYKKGQGYWTRMGTVGAVALIGLLSASFLYSNLLPDLGVPEHASYLVIALFVLAYSFLAFHLLNKPTSVDFLIATDSEMKKVNWTNKTELFGSTRVVIGFMFIIAIVLLIYDLFFHTIFYLIGVLKIPPPFFPQSH